MRNFASIIFISYSQTGISYIRIYVDLVLPDSFVTLHLSKNKNQ